MWMMMPGGMAMPGLRPDHTLPEGDLRVLQVRGRRKEHLEYFVNNFMTEGEVDEIIHTPQFDYNYRFYCTLEAWARACYNAAMNITYVKFKEQSEKMYGDKELHDVYSSMWATATRLGTPYEADATSGGWSMWDDYVPGGRSLGGVSDRYFSTLRTSPYYQTAEEIVNELFPDSGMDDYSPERRGMVLEDCSLCDHYHEYVNTDNMTCYENCVKCAFGYIEDETPTSHVEAIAEEEKQRDKLLRHVARRTERKLKQQQRKARKAVLQELR